MLKENFKKILLYTIIILVIFFVDRISKLYVIGLAEIENTVDVYLNPYLNIYLIWNKGIAFGLLSFKEDIVYNIITSIIASITLIVLVMAVKTKSFKRYALLFVFAGSIGNLFDRIYYSAVPDFIDFHYNNFHWFTFNVADIFITLGILIFILRSFFIKKKK